MLETIKIFMKLEKLQVESKNGKKNMLEKQLLYILSSGQKRVKTLLYIPPFYNYTYKKKQK